MRVFGTVLFLCFAATLNRAPGVSAQQLRVTIQMPEDSLIYETALAFKNRVEEESQKSITIKLAPNSTLFKAAEVKSAVGSGAIEMGASLLTEYTGVAPASQIFSLPFLFSNKQVAAQASARGSVIRVPIEEEVRAATGGRVLWWVPLAAQVIIGHDTAFLSPKDLRGKRLRAVGTSMPELIQGCGGDPVVIGGPDQYEAYKSRKVDGGMTFVDTVASRKLWEVANTVVLTRQIFEAWVVVVNDKVWRTLSAQQQMIITQAAQAAENLAVMKIDALEKSAIAQASSHGMTVFEPSDDDVDEWKACTNSMNEEFLKKTGARGQALLNSYRQLLVGALRSPAN